MKMDATQKRRMWKVAICHLALTVFIGLVILNFFNAYRFSGTTEMRLKFETYKAWHNAWGSIWIAGFCFLQPQFWFLGKFEESIFHAFPNLIVQFFGFFSIPLWSICFSWLFVKLDNWLNHFPVLGKKVF